MMKGIDAAMAEMERGRAVFEAAAQKVLVALHELQSDVLAANGRMHVTQMEMVTAARKRRRSGTQRGAQVIMPPIEAPDEQAFADSALDVEEHVETTLRAMARVHGHTIDVRAAVDATKARAAPRLVKDGRKFPSSLRRKSLKLITWSASNPGSIASLITRTPVNPCAI